MLVLTQMSVGAFIVDYWWFGRGSGLDPNLAAAIHPAHLFTALASGLLGLGASVLHLGRPRYAYRALLGLRHSWLSREILCFGLFAASAAAYVAVGWLGPTLSISVAGVQSMLGALSAGLGVAAVGCSVMIYADTPRPFWSGPRTGLKFVLTAAILGCCVSLVVCVLSAAISPRATIQDALGSLGVPLCQGIVVALGAKLLFETAIFGHLRRAGGRRRRRRDPLTRSAGLLAGPLSMIVVKRYFCGLLGLLLSVTLIEQATIAPQGGFHPLFIVILAVLMFALLTTGELMERYLFFAASIPPKMPGGTMS